MNLKILFSLISLFVISENIIAQQWGFSLGYATSNSFFGDFLYQEKNISFHLGYSHQFSDAKGKEVSDQKSNYGKTVVGQGNYFYSIDLGLGYHINSKVRINAELSIGSNEYFTNYSDKRFTDDGYHMITKSESIIGLGGSASYSLQNWELFIGYNTLRKLGLGFRVIFF